MKSDIPNTLKQLNQWVLWRLEQRNGKSTKVPLSTQHRPIDVTKSSSSASFIAVCSSVQRDEGVGFVLTGTNIVAVDVDHCYQNGEFSQLAMELMGLLPTYVELSQSKTGLHLIYLDNDIPADFSGRKGVVEIYADKRYIALTGWKITDSTADLTMLNGMTKRLLNTYFPNTGYNSSADFQTTLEQHSYPPVQSDDAVLQSLQSNQKFQRLYGGDISGYPSQSEADGALMLILATATALNATQMRRLFSQSALGKRDKWCNRVWYQDYLITGAIRFAESKGDDDEMDKNPSNQFILQSDYFANHYYQDAAIIRGYSHRNTGFKSLNKVQPLPPSLLVIGAEPGTGKTTFCYQLAEQLQQIKDDRFKKIIIDTILPCRYEVFVLNGSPHTFGIKFHAESPVFLYALAKRQITVIPAAVLNVPKTKNTQFFRELKMYINIRIDKIKRTRENPKTKNFPRVIKLETLYSKCLIPPKQTDYMQKKRIREDIALYMDYLVDQSVITGFQFVDDNDKPRKNLKDCTKITFTYDDALPRVTLNWLTDK